VGGDGSGVGVGNTMRRDDELLCEGQAGALDRGKTGCRLPAVERGDFLHAERGVPHGGLRAATQHVRDA